jgi:hypothetical protein
MLDENEDEKYQQENDQDLLKADSSMAACLNGIDMHGKLVDLFVRKAVQFRHGLFRGKPVIHKALLNRPGFKRILDPGQISSPVEEQNPGPG